MKILKKSVEHILNIYEEGELVKETSLRKIGISDFSTKFRIYKKEDVLLYKKSLEKMPL